MKIFNELCADIWNVYAAGLEGIKAGNFYGPEPCEVTAKLSGMHRVITIMRDCECITRDEAQILRNFISDCRDDINELWR